MAVKKVYEIKDLILNDVCEVSGQSGVLGSKENGLMLLDFNQMAQYIIENSSQSEYEIFERDLSNVCVQWSYEISKIILDEVYESAISDINDDEELELI